jgi:small GTP-binding protein
MGQTWQRYKTKNQRRVLLVGLDAAGKTTLLFRLYSGKTLNTVPTVGFNAKTFNYQGLSINMWDVGGQDELREFWRHHFTGTQGLIYVVDASDRDRLEEASQLFETVVTDLQLVDASILILANKQDLPHAVSSDELAKIFQVERLCQGRKIHLQATTATTNEGVNEGMDWLAHNMERL